MSSKRALIMALLSLLALAGYALVSTSDADMAALDEQHYCRMVNNGLWPDFKEMKNDC